MNEIRMVQERNPQPEEIAVLSDAIEAFNQAHIGYSDAAPLAIFLRDRENRILGGIFGHTYWGWLAIDFLWVHEDLRGQQYGRRLLQTAEQEARDRGCRHVLVDTLSFQAPGFYRKHGYTVYGTLDNFAGEHQRVYLQKDL